MYIDSRRRRSNSTLPAEVIQAKRQRFWENTRSQTDNNEILPDLTLATNYTSPTSSDVHLTAPILNSLTMPVSQTLSIQRCKSQKKLIRDRVTEQKVPTSFDSLDYRSLMRDRDLIINIPKKLYNPLTKSIIYTVPVMSKNSSINLGMVRPTMAGCLMNQYERNLKTTKKSQKHKEKTLNVMTLLDDFFNKKPIERENVSYNESRNQQDANIEELDASLELDCGQSRYTRSRRSSIISNIG